MAEINFPASPDLNDTHIVSGTTWQWNGTAWVVVDSQTGVNNITVVTGDTGSFTADQSGDTVNIVGGTNIDTSISADTLTINFSGEVGGAGDVFKTVTSDDGSAVASGANDTLSILGGTNISTNIATDTKNVAINLDAFSIDFLSDVDTTSSTPTTGQVLKWDGSKWAPGVDATTGGAGTDADTLDGFDGSYYLDYNNFSNTPTILTLSALSIGNELPAAGDGAITYDNTTGVFRYTPPDLSSYLTSETNDLTASVTWANVPDANITESSVTQHQSALSITESQISDLGSYITDYTVVASDLNSISIDALSDVDTTTSAPSNDQVLSWNGSAWVPADVTGGGSGEVNQNAFSNIAVSGQTTVAADTATDTLTLIAGTGISLSTNATNDSVTITSTSSGGATSFDGLSDASTAGIDIDAVYEHAMMTFRVTANGFSAYRFESHYGTTDNPTIYVLNGTTVAFDLNNATGHPFEIQDSTGTAYNTGLVHVASDGTVSTGSSAQGKSSGTLYWRIPASLSSPPNFRYQCTAHVAMVGAITIKSFSAL